MTKTIQLLWPLWLYEIFLGLSGHFTGGLYALLIVLTVIGSIRFTFTWK